MILNIKFKWTRISFWYRTHSGEADVDTWAAIINDEMSIQKTFGIYMLYKSQQQKIK